MIPIPASASTSESYGAAAPAFGVDTAVPAGVRVRLVFGSVALAGTATVGARVDCVINGAVVQDASVPAGTTTTWRRPYSFAVRGGDSYRFDNLNAGGSESIQHYSFIDLF